MTSSLRVEQEAADWVAQCDRAGFAAGQGVVEAFSAADDAFAEWVNRSSSNRVAFLRLYSAWRRADRLAALAPRERAVRERRRRRMAASLAALAAAACLVAAAFLYVLQAENPASAEVFQTALGEHETVTLPDGTVIELNTSTRLSARVGEERRLVTLEEGEAYFDVAHDAARPFSVDAGGSRLTVLGTAFNVRRNTGSVRVVVAEGAVKVESVNQPAGARPAIARKGTSVHADADGALISSRTEDEIAAALSWRYGRLVFDDMELGTIASEFNRYNRVKLVLADRDTAGIRMGGSFDAREVESFVRLLEQDFGFDVTRQDDTFVIGK